jgi:hypothetical protein
VLIEKVLSRAPPSDLICSDYEETQQNEDKYSSNIQPHESHDNQDDSYAINKTIGDSMCYSTY